MAIPLWPIPNLSQAPLHTLPLDQLLAKLRGLTNLRMTKNTASPTGWSWTLDPLQAGAMFVLGSRAGG